MTDDETDDVDVEESIDLITVAGRKVLADRMNAAYNQGFRDGVAAHTERIAAALRRAEGSISDRVE